MPPLRGKRPMPPGIPVSCASGRAIVRDGRYVVAVGKTLETAIAEANKTFYAGRVPDYLVVRERADPMDTDRLAALPCTEAFLTAHQAPWFLGAWRYAGGVACLDYEVEPILDNQLALF